ncbi:uncharacterized protein PV09_03024 [Verruconis gallopava]|uniref:Uncharacterized protein n=1 Tax=Verruconis gallopava TaxID=253628 RepID=A0A0D2AFR6_9PEZI|nr:uncharacterized protein PV09_03024 [Verruconis gallopava]KIW05818.1 hypothetical protein PV09_03024 [Verruconis gallopava]
MALALAAAQQNSQQQQRGQFWLRLLPAASNPQFQQVFVNTCHNIQQQFVAALPPVDRNMQPIRAAGSLKIVCRWPATRAILAGIVNLKIGQPHAAIYSMPRWQPPAPPTPFPAGNLPVLIELSSDEEDEDKYKEDKNAVVRQQNEGFIPIDLVGVEEVDLTMVDEDSDESDDEFFDAPAEQ